MNVAIEEMCRKSKITDYLLSKGIILHKTRKGAKCCCPIPGHQDDTPSFNITTSSRDGAEIFKCFGCQKSGNIITLMSLMENQKKGFIVKKLSSIHGIKLDNISYEDRLDPLEDDIISSFCIEDIHSRKISEIALEFLKSQRGSEDSVNKVTRIYRKLDVLIEEGDDKGIAELMSEFKSIIFNYQRF